jgi:hypothetical protein
MDCSFLLFTLATIRIISPGDLKLNWKITAWVAEIRARH